MSPDISDDVYLIDNIIRSIVDDYCDCDKRSSSVLTLKAIEEARYCLKNHPINLKNNI